jgi:hypothetical protein
MRGSRASLEFGSLRAGIEPRLATVVISINFMYSGIYEK